MKSSELSCSEPLQREQRILSSLCCPYVVTYKGCDITMENNNKLMYNLFMEYMPFGTLVQATHRHGGGRLDEAAIACYTRQVVKGLEHLHSKGLVHCDIKGANILIGEDGVKIGDFGCAKSVTDDSAAIGGTPVFMAPEVARGREQGCPSDIWSLGCTVIEMATGASPWPNVVAEADPISVLYHLAYSDVVPEIPCFLSEEARDFLGKCFRRNPRERWTASQLLKHPFLGEYLCSSNANNNKQVVVVESKSSSPTSILEQGFWSDVEESGSLGNLIHAKGFENSSPADRVRRLASSSGEPRWAWHHDDDDGENWITTRGDEVGVFGNCGSETGSASDELALQGLVESNVKDSISGHFGHNHIHNCRDSSVVVGNLNFEPGIVPKMFIPSTLDFF